MFWSSKSKKLDASEAPTADRCSFCKKAQADVGKLVVGPGVAMCDECLALSAAILEENTNDELAFPSIVATACEVLKNPKISAERAKAVARVGQQAANGGVGFLSRLAESAFDGEHYEMVVEALQSSPVESLPPQAAVHLVVALWNLGEFEEGLRLAQRAPADQPRFRALRAMMRSSFALRLEQLDEQRLSDMLIELRQAALTLGLPESDLAYVIAEVLTRLGRHRAAKDLLVAKNEYEDLTGFETLILGDATLGLGDRPEALRLYHRAKELGGPIAGEVERRLVKLSPYR